MKGAYGLPEPEQALARYSPRNLCIEIPWRSLEAGAAFLLRRAEVKESKPPVLKRAGRAFALKPH